MERARWAATLLLWWLARAGTALADPIEVERGRLVAEGRCGKCHAIGPTGASPQRIVPPFRALAERFPIDMLIDTLQTGTVSGHDEMPMFELGLDDARALIAFIDSLSPTGARYLAAPERR